MVLVSSVSSNARRSLGATNISTAQGHYVGVLRFALNYLGHERRPGLKRTPLLDEVFVAVIDPEALHWHNEHAYRG